MSQLMRLIRPVLLPYLLSRLLVLLVAILLEWLLVSGTVKRYAYISEAPLSTLSATFDANWYGDIASSGYNTSPDITQQHNYHFLPLYPGLMRVAGDLLGLGGIQGGYNLAGVFVSHILFLAVLVLLYYLTLRIWGDERLARNTVWLMCALPWSFVFSMTYTESLFLAMTLAAFFVAYRAREKPGGLQALHAGLWAMLAVLTRQQGMLVALSVGWLVAVAPRRLSLPARLRNAVLAASPAILAYGVFALYIASRTGNLLAVIQAKGAWGEGWLSDLHRIFILPPGNPAWVLDFMETIALATWTALTIAVIACAISMYKANNIPHAEPIRREASAGTSVPEDEGTKIEQKLGMGALAFVGYAFASYLLAITNTQANQSWGRYMLVAFPCVWVLAWWWRNVLLFPRLIVVSLGLEIIFFAAAIVAQVTP